VADPEAVKRVLRGPWPAGLVQRLLIDLEACCIPAPDVIVALKEKR